MTDHNEAPRLEESPTPISFSALVKQLEEKHQSGVNMKLPEAVAQLRKSERGTESLEAFWKVIDETAYGLDCCNWGAMQAICRTMATDPNAFPKLRDLMNQ